MLLIQWRSVKRPLSREYGKSPGLSLKLYLLSSLTARLSILSSCMMHLYRRLFLADVSGYPARSISYTIVAI